MNPTPKSRRGAPSVSSLRKLRSEMLEVLSSLQDARARTRDVGERARIQGAMVEVGRRAKRLAAAIDTVARLRDRQKAYEDRIARLDGRIEKVLGRSYRGNSRWLRRWRNL